MKIAIIGGGASGLACAARLSQSQNSIDIFEKNSKLAKKILATGNGRCNILQPYKREYISLCGKNAYPKLFEKYSSFSFFQELGIETFEEADGRCYPLSNQASSVADALKFAVFKPNINIFTDTEVEKIEALKQGFLVDGKKYDIVVLAFGSAAGVPSYNGKNLILNLGHSFSNVYPALVRLKTNPSIQKNLHGVRARASVSLFESNIELARETGEVQFSSGFISGVCVMQLSLFASKLLSQGKSPCLKIDFLPELKTEQVVSIMKRVRKNLPSAPSDMLLSGIVNQKLASEILKQCKVSHSDLCADVSNKKLFEIAEKAKNFLYSIVGTDEFSSAQLMLGGVPLCEVDSNSMESKNHQGLFLCGELLDISGFCGGYNLNWAWCSGLAAAESILNYDKT